MKHLILIVFTVLLAACSDPRFVADAPAVPKTSNTPKHFDLPARFAYVRTVYGAQSAAGAKESALWADLANSYRRSGKLFPARFRNPSSRVWQSGQHVRNSPRAAFQIFNFGPNGPI